MKALWVFVGLCAGLLVGILATVTASPWLLALVRLVEPAGTIFVNAIRMAVVPLVVASLIGGIVSITNTRSLTRMGARSLIVFVALTFSAAITFFLAGLGAFLFARELGCRESVSLVAAAGWMYAKPLAFFVLWAVGSSWALFPFVMLGTRRCVRAPSVRSATLLCVALTLLVLAGHPESVLQAVFVGAIYGLVELARVRRNALRVLAAAGGAGIVALGLTAIYILPILEAAPQTAEHPFRKEVWAKMSHAVTPRESAARLLTDLFSYLHGHRWEWGDVHHLPLDAATAGSIALGVAIYAVWRIRNGDTWFFGGLALFGFLTRAAWKPLFDLIQKLPMFDITINERFAFAGAFALVILAALGLERAAEQRDVALGITLAATLFALVVGGVVIAHTGIVSMSINDWGRFSYFGEIGCLAIAALIAMWRLPARAAVPLILGALLLQHVCAEGDIYPTLPASVAYPPVPMFAAMKNVREPFRIVAHAHGFIPGTSALYELEDVRGYEALTFARYITTYQIWCVVQPIWFNRIDEFKPFLNFLNVRYSIAGPTTPVPDGWRLVAKQRGTQLFENQGVIERAFIPRLIRASYPEDVRMTEMAETTDFRDRAWIELTGMTPQEFANGRGRITSLRRNGPGFDVTADMEQNGWIVFSEPGWKGWRVYLDGRRMNWSFANQAFIAAWVPAGHHQLQLAYLPGAFVTGRAITFTTLGAIAFAVVAMAIRRRRAGV